MTKKIETASARQDVTRPASDAKLIEWRPVADPEMYEAHRAAAVRPPLTPSAKKTARSDDPQWVSRT